VRSLACLPGPPGPASTLPGRVEPAHRPAVGGSGWRAN
jgi:hypothetical protein